MDEKIVFSTWMPRMYGLALIVLCTATLPTPVRAQTWAQQSPATSPPARDHYAMAYDSAHHQVVLFGGYNGTALADTWVWDGSNWTQKTPSASPSARFIHAMVSDSARGQVLLFGGYNGTNVLGDTWVWDGNNWTQKSTAISPSARFSHAMAYDSGHMQVVLFAGSPLVGNDFQDTWVWDGNNWTQKSPATSPSARFGHGMTYDLTHGQTVLFGGEESSTYLSDTWVWDGANWVDKSPVYDANPPARMNHALAYDASPGQVVLFGGYDGDTYRADTWIWDGNNWNVESSSGSPAARTAHAMAYDSLHGQMVLFGGGNSTLLADTWIWCRNSFANWAQEVPAASPSPREDFAMAYDSLHGQMVLFGGDNGASLNDTWVWNGANWSEKSPGTSPSGRNFHAMAYDSLHGQMVLFGGFGGGYPTDTWVWDGTNWTQKFPSTSPPGRENLAMAYDSAHGQVVLFGGRNGSGNLADTWVWDGTNWTQKSPGTSPPARAAHAMAYDSLHGQVVLFGGYGGSFLSDTWIWDGSNWTARTPAVSPAPRANFATAYDSVHQMLVLFGGNDSNTDFSDTWLWDGTNWTQKSSSTSPAPHDSHAMAYDSLRGQVLLFGGESIVPSLDAGNSVGVVANDTWLWEGGFSVSPNTGSGTGPEVFSATYYDTNGASDLQAVYLDFGSLGDAPNNCKIAYVPGNNTLYLFNNANNGVIGSVILGGGGSISNSQCTLFGGSSAASPFGNNLTVPIDIQFLAGYGGLKTIFAVAQTYGGTQSGNGIFEDIGTWTPAATTPGVVSVTPSTGGGLGPQVFSAVFSDSGGASDLQAVYLDFGSVGGFAARNCIVAYTPGLNQLYLFNDNNTGALGPIALGAGGGTLSNSQCTLSSGNTAATLSGTTLTVPFNITFLTGYGGKKFVFGLSQTYAGTQSNGGAQTQLGAWEPATSTPSAVSLNPNSGTGSSQVFTAGYSDTGGANDLQVVYLSFSTTTFLAANSCNVGYEPGNNTLFLFSDNNATIATVGEDGAGSVSNSQCTLSGGTTAAAESGIGLTVPFTITFKSGFTSALKVFGLAQTYDGTQSATTQLGTWLP